jgi:hypothetical protein
MMANDVAATPASSPHKADLARHARDQEGNVKATGKEARVAGTSSYDHARQFSTVLEASIVCLLPRCSTCGLGVPRNHHAIGAVVGEYRHHPHRLYPAKSGEYGTGSAARK